MPNFCGYPDGPCSLNDDGHERHPPSDDGYKFPKRSERGLKAERARPAVKTQIPINNNKQPSLSKPRRMTLGGVTSGIMREPHRIFIYGDGGLGKSTFFAEAGNTIFLDTQDGTKKIALAKRFPRPESWQDVLDAIDELLITNHSYKTLAIDLIDDIEQLIYAHICDRDEKENIEAYGFNKGPTIALVEWRQLLSRLERLRREKGMQIGFVGHAAVMKFKNPEGEDYGRFAPQINEKASGLVRGWCDTVLFARLETMARTDSKTKRTRGITTGARLLYTNGTAAYFAKNRDNLPESLPLDWAAFAEAVEAGIPADAETLLNEIRELTSRLDDETRGTVEEKTAEALNEPNKLVRILNRLREKVQPQVQASEGAQ